MNRKDFMKGLLAVACGASVVSAIAAQYNAEQPTDPGYAPEGMSGSVPRMTPEEVERIGKEEMYIRKAYAERYNQMQYEALQKARNEGYTYIRWVYTTDNQLNSVIGSDYVWHPNPLPIKNNSIA